MSSKKAPFTAFDQIKNSLISGENSKSQKNPNEQNSKFQTCLGHWILEFEIYLEFGAWYLRLPEEYLLEPLTPRTLDPFFILFYCFT
jgi:hypothetical protein